MTVTRPKGRTIHSNPTLSPGFRGRAMHSRFLLPAALVALGCVLGFLAASGRLVETFAQDKKTVDPPVSESGTQLPKPDPAFKGKIGETYKDSTPDYPQAVKAPKGAPNVLVV